MKVKAENMVADRADPDATTRYEPAHPDIHCTMCAKAHPDSKCSTCIMVCDIQQNDIIVHTV